MKTLIFGYGSLINDISRKKTAPGAEVIDRESVLEGYGRKTNLQYGDFVYMNIVPAQDKNIVGTLVAVGKEELGALTIREEGYSMKDITNNMTKSYGQQVFAFVAPAETDNVNVQVPQSYLNTCTANMTEQEKTQWIADTDIPYGVYDDMQDSVYENAA